MALCTACGTSLPGRRQKCDACKNAGRPAAKAGPTKTSSSAPKKPPPRRTPTTQKKATAKKAAAKRKPADQTRAPRSRGRSYPAGLRDRGRALWKALGHDEDTVAGQLALEACRLADRLDRLDSALSGADAWLDLVEQIPGSGHHTIVVDRLLAEARQQQSTYRAIMADLGAKAAAGHTGKPAPQKQPDPDTGPNPQASTAPAPTPLEAARARRRQQLDGG